MTAELLAAPIVQGDDRPWCPFCGGLMLPSQDGRALVCVACDCDALVDGCPA